MAVKPKKKSIALLAILLLSFAAACNIQAVQVSTPMTDTGQNECYGNSGKIAWPSPGQGFDGQDAQYRGNRMAYQDNGDGTVTDLVTGLMWTRAVDLQKVSIEEAQMKAKQLRTGGFSDWRVPNIKELYSLMNFSGSTGSPRSASQIPSDAVPFINTDYFDFMYGNTGAGERYIDAQWLSRTLYVDTTMGGALTLFGVNFADGRIKGYGFRHPAKGLGGRKPPEKKFFVRFVRGASYGENDFKDNHDGTVTDENTGLMWMKNDSGKGMNWASALSYAENITYAGYSDWRLPNAKELQYIVDYTRSPSTTGSPAIDPVFQSTAITNEKGQKDFPYYWTSTTHLEGPRPGRNGVYIAFGRGMGKMRGIVMDVHGAGCQRSDPKSGRGGISRGPQGDWVRVNNYVRLVRGGSVARQTEANEIDASSYPNTIRVNGVTSVPKTSSNLGLQSGFPQNPSRGVFQQGPNQQDMNRQGPGPYGGKGFVRRLDRDGDNRVSSREFDGPSQHFSMFDKNHDGYITADEAPTGPPPQRPGMFSGSSPY